MLPETFQIELYLVNWCNWTRDGKKQGMMDQVDLIDVITM